MSLISRATEPATTGVHSIQHAAHASSLDIPRGHVGPYWLPGTGRLIWWTGRVAIGLRHEGPSRSEAISISEEWVQQLLIDARPHAWVN